MLSKANKVIMKDEKGNTYPYCFPDQKLELTSSSSSLESSLLRIAEALERIAYKFENQEAKQCDT